MKHDSVLLPGLDQQFSFLIENIPLAEKKTLVVGSGSEEIAKEIFSYSTVPVELIVENYESLINSRLSVEKEFNVNCSLMDFHSTDFANESFDLIYSQASITTANHRKILKEFSRILKPKGFLCVGELTKLSAGVPKFINDILEMENLSPMQIDELLTAYSSQDFALITKKELNRSFYEYLRIASIKVGKVKNTLTESEISFHKKLLNRFSHEANSFLKHGGDKYIGFYVFVFQKGVKN